MDLQNPDELLSRFSLLQSSLCSSSKTTDFLNPFRSEPLELSVCLSLTNSYTSLYTLLKSIYIKEQSNDFLQYLTIVSAYASKNYQEALFLAQDLLASTPTREVFVIILKITVNHLNLHSLASHFSQLAVQLNPSDEILLSARAVVCLSLLPTTLYHSNRFALLSESKRLLETSKSKGKNVIFFRALTNAHLGLINEALSQASEGLKITMSSYYVGLVALLMMSLEDFTGSLNVIKRGLQANPGNILLHCIRLYCKFLMFEHTSDKETIKKSIASLIRMFRDSPNDESSSIAGAIKEEASNIDSGYIEDVFQDIKEIKSEDFQQVLKIVFKISIEICDFDLAFSIVPQLVNANLENAICEFYREQKFEGLEEFHEDVWACEILANHKYEVGDISMALTLCKQAIRLNQNSKKSWVLLGKIYKEQNLLEEAMEAYLNGVKSVDINFSLIPIYLEDF